MRRGAAQEPAATRTRRPASSASTVSASTASSKNTDWNDPGLSWIATTSRPYATACRQNAVPAACAGQPWRQRPVAHFLLLVRLLNVLPLPPSSAASSSSRPMRTSAAPSGASSVAAATPPTGRRPARRRLTALEHETVRSGPQRGGAPGMCGLTVLCSARQHGRKIPFVLLGASETERTALDRERPRGRPLPAAAARRRSASSKWSCDGCPAGLTHSCARPDLRRSARDRASRPRVLLDARATSHRRARDEVATAHASAAIEAAACRCR